MLNEDDVKNLDRLLTLVKRSSVKDSVEFHYSTEYGWRVGVFPKSYISGDMYYSSHQFKKKRLGELCFDLIVEMVQERLGGEDG